MTQRSAMLHSTIDFGRSYGDIEDARGYWGMEQWLHWTETWSVIILQPFNGIPVLHHPDILTMWEALRGIVCHFMRPMVEHADQAAKDEVQRRLSVYSQLAQTVFGPAHCKWNLHMINCRCAFMMGLTLSIILSVESTIL